MRRASWVDIQIGMTRKGVSDAIILEGGLNDLESHSKAAFVSRHAWNSERPHVLVVACSDGRIQVNLDEFLSSHLGIQRYDRVYLPGGPGALATSGVEYIRSDLHRRELTFLLTAHDIQELLLIFHGPAADGPIEALCADYVRILGRPDAEVIAATQLKDLAEVEEMVRLRSNTIRVRGYRCEVGPNGHIGFVSMKTVTADESSSFTTR